MLFPGNNIDENLNYFVEAEFKEFRKINLTILFEGRQMGIPGVREKLHRILPLTVL